MTKTRFYSAVPGLSIILKFFRVTLNHTVWSRVWSKSLILPFNVLEKSYNKKFICIEILGIRCINLSKRSIRFKTYSSRVNWVSVRGLGTYFVRLHPAFESLLKADKKTRMPFIFWISRNFYLSKTRHSYKQHRFMI